MVKASAGHQGWWLYGNDLSLARKMQHEMIHATGDWEQKAYQISLLTQLGDYRACHQWLQRTQALQYSVGRKALCRVLLAEGKADSWTRLLHSQELLAVLDQLSLCIQKYGQKLLIEMTGGIGDQLQTSSLVLALNSSGPFKDRLRIKPVGGNAEVVEPLLRACNITEVLSRQDDALIGATTSSSFRILMLKTQAEPHYRQLASVKSMPVDSGRGITILTCWRTHPDPENPLTSFSRSLPFQRVLALMKQWQPGLDRLRMMVFDLTKYSADEQAIIAAQFPHVRMIWQQITSLADTIEFMTSCQRIVSVDTSLTHLAATLGRDVDLLLPLYPDERWLELLQAPGVYREHVTAHRQVAFHNWEEPLKALSRSLLLG